MYTSYKEIYYPKREEILTVTGDMHNNIVPSDTIFYYRYPYCVKFSIPELDSGDFYERRKQLAMFEIELEQFRDEVLTGDTRSVIRKKSQRMYIRKFADLQRSLTVFGDGIQQAIGPISDDHIDILLANDQMCDIRDSYYGKFDSKVYICVDLDWDLNSSSYFGGFTAAKDSCFLTRQEIRKYIFANTDSSNFKASSTGSALDFYINYSNFEQLLPFLKLQFPNTRFIVTRCIQ